LGCSRDVPKVRPSNGDSQEEDIEPKGNGVLDTHDDLFVIAYLQTSGGFGWIDTQGAKLGYA